MNTPDTPSRGRGRPATGRDPQHQFRCPNDEWAMFTEAAEAEGVTVAVWIRRVAMKAATRVLKHSETE